MMRFVTNLKVEAFQGRLRNAGLEFEYDGFEALDAPRQTAPLVVSKTLSLEFNVATGRILYLWGYSPKETWKKGEVSDPSPAKGAVFVEFDDRKPEPGVGIDVDTLFDVQEVFDANTGWVLIGVHNADQAVEIATGIVLGLDGDKLVAVWLKPS